MQHLRFSFQEVPDRIGGTVLRPLVNLRLDTAPPGTRQLCLVDTGSPDTVLDWSKAQTSGINPYDGDPVTVPPGFSVGGVAVTEVRGFTLRCLIEDDRHFVPLPFIPILFVKPWGHLGFTAVLGTRAMNSIRIEMSVRERWIEVSPELAAP
jgi:hypothetical protein